MGLLPLHTCGDCRCPLSSTWALSYVGCPCKGQRTPPPPPHRAVGAPEHRWVPPQITAKVFSSSRSGFFPALSPPGIQNNHLIPSWKLFGILQGSWRSGQRQELLPRIDCRMLWRAAQGKQRGTLLGLLGQRGWRRQEAAGRRRSNLGIHHPAPRDTQQHGVGGSTHHQRGRQRPRCELSLRNSQTNWVNKAVA